MKVLARRIESDVKEKYLTKSKKHQRSESRGYQKKYFHFINNSNKDIETIVKMYEIIGRRK